MSLVGIVCCQKSLRWADHSSRGVLPIMACLIVLVSIDNEEAFAHYCALVRKKCVNRQSLSSRTFDVKVKVDSHFVLSTG